MQKVRVIASILFYFSRILSIPYLATALYCIICFIFSSSLVHPFDDGKRFTIYYPFTQQRFLIGDDYSFRYIFEMISIIGLYGIFLWLLGNVFKIFREKKLFTEKGVTRLKAFYLLNFLAPLPYLFVHLISGYEMGELIVIAILHTVAGIFAYFMAVIFSRGVQLQQEQDLIF
jgi:hypothetical protein